MPHAPEHIAVASPSQAEAVAQSELYSKIAIAIHMPEGSVGLQGNIAKAAQGDYVYIPGASGSFAGMDGITSDRAYLDTKFREYGLGNAYRAIDRVTNWTGAEMSAREFYSYSDTSSERVLDLIRSGGMFAIRGTEAEIFPAESMANRRGEAHRQLWSPLRISGDRIPVYELTTTPTEDVRSRRSSFIQHGWMLLPQLVIPE